MLLRELSCAALGWALAVVTWVAASRLPRSLLSDDFGADGLPRRIAVALAIVSTLIAARALWQRRSGAASETGAPGSLREHARALGIVALGFGYVLLAPSLGYIPAAVLLIAATAWYYGARLSSTLVAMSAAGAVILWLMFAKMLGISMPPGFWSRLWG